MTSKCAMQYSKDSFGLEVESKCTADTSVIAIPTTQIESCCCKKLTLSMALYMDCWHQGFSVIIR